MPAAEGMRSLSKVIKAYQVRPAPACSIGGDRALSPESCRKNGEVSSEEFQRGPLREAGEITRARKEAERLIRTAQARAEQILKQAEARAESIIDRTVEGAEKIAEEARAQALADGRAEGLAEGKSEAQKIIAEAEAIRGRAAAEKEEMLAGSQGDIARLALVAAGKIVRREIQVDPDCVFDMIAEALGRVKGEDSAVLQVNPKTAAVLEENTARLISASQGVREVRIVPDPSLEPGDCLVESSRGSVDARIETKIANLERAVLSVVDHG